MIIGVILLAISLSIDALGIGCSYGLRKIKVPLAAKCIIAVISMMVTALAVFLGAWINQWLPGGVAQALGAGILIVLGLWILVQGAGEEKPKDTQIEEKTIFHMIIRSLGITIQIIKRPEICDINRSNRIEPGEALYLGFALSMDSIGVGIASASLGFNYLMIPLFVAFFQILFLSAGILVGKKLSGFRVDHRVWTYLSGLLLIFIGIARIF